MKQVEVFVFGIINTFILIAVLLWLFRRLARQFFYARRIWLKKEFISSYGLLKGARQRIAQCLRSKEGLPDEISMRRRAVSSRADAECAAIIGEARRRADRIVDNAQRQAEEERARALAEVRERLLGDAFSRAMNLLPDEMTDDVQKRIVKQGVEEFEGLFSQAARK